MTLADIAPRLALARDQRVAELYRLAASRSRLKRRVAHLEWLVEHRELQLLRAPYIGRSARTRQRYERHRASKLAAARDELRHAQAKLATVEQEAAR